MTVTEPTGRRERKKLRTREALISSAFELFARKGFEATTVEEIADAVDVSSRTFFRYFASKEDVALTFQEEQHAALLAALAARPADEPIMTALRRTVVGIARACEQGEQGFDPDRFQCLQSLMASSSALLASSLEHSQKKQADLTRAVADRMGLDPATDLRPHVVAATAICTMNAAADAMRAGVLGDACLAETADRAFAILDEGWDPPRA
ncbi:TetR family transcriptional regulator [Actinomadura craniellae]|uniref:TetR family transcriptional regulator n=1 Tax=Actinomadura craniellae TaxID=2231787 RepID=A0A365H304_9ACTN|nr:TetR family transcriptional regulator [Actinomadura craniellae]RAY13485.1 TetR family transcriptional regulator [Actinomadura craniellae]